jgi:hypothetical protein
MRTEEPVAGLPVLSSAIPSIGRDRAQVHGRVKAHAHRGSAC